MLISSKQIINFHNFLKQCHLYVSLVAKSFQSQYKVKFNVTFRSGKGSILTIHVISQDRTAFRAANP